MAALIALFLAFSPIAGAREPMVQPPKDALIICKSKAGDIAWINKEFVSRMEICFDEIGCQVTQNPGVKDESSGGKAGCLWKSNEEIPEDPARDSGHSYRHLRGKTYEIALGARNPRKKTMECETKTPCR